MRRWIGGMSSWISQVSFRNLALGLMAMSLVIGPYTCGNPTFLVKGELVAIMDAQGDDSDHCFEEVFHLQSAVERSYREDGMFRESVLQYHYKINLPVPDPTWPEHVKSRMTICGMMYGPQLLEAGVHDGDIQEIMLHVLLARDRKDPKFWYVLETNSLCSGVLP